MAQNETWLKHDLMKAVRVQYLDGNLFSMDNAGNLIGVTLTRDGEDYTGGGSVSANVIRADGGTVTVTGSLSGNAATVVLPQAAYVVPGAVSIVVKLTASGQVTTIAAIVANVYRSSTDTPIDPGTIIPSVQALIAAIDTAVASIPADYSSLWASLAPAFSTSNAYTAGQYVTYNGGLYRFTADHAAGAWSSSHVVAVNIGGELSDLKSAITLYTGNEEITNLTKNYYINTAGTGTPADTYSLTPVSNSNWSYMVINASEGDKFTIKATGGGGARLWAFCDSDSGTGYDGKILAKADSSISLDYGVIVAPQGTTKLIINVSNSAIAHIYKGEFVKEDIEELQQQFADLGIGDEIVTGDLIENQGVEISFANSGTMWNSNGEIISNQYSTGYKAINGVIDVVPGETYTFEGLYSNQYVYGLLMFLDSNQKNGTQVSVNSNTFEYTVPSGKSKVCLTSYNFATSLDNVKIIGNVETGKLVLDNVSLTEEQIEKVIENIPPDDSYKKFKGKKIVNFGDSIFGQARPPFDISTKLAELTGATVYNAGFGGCQMAYHATANYNNFSMYKLADAIAETAEGAADAWDAQETAAAQSGMPSYYSDTVAMLKAIDWAEIDIITISYGTNDFYNGLALLPLPDATPKNRAVDWALQYSIDKIQTAYPNIRIFVCLPMYRYFTAEQTDSNSITHTSWVDGQIRTFLQFVEAERNTAKNNQIPVLDTYYDLGINQYNWTHYIPANDGTHHNQTGRNLIAEFMADKMW